MQLIYGLSVEAEIEVIKAETKVEEPSEEEAEEEQE